MLTMREPIKLTTQQPVCAMPDTLADKLLSNYELMQAQFSPKNLLYLLAVSPELPEDLGGMTTFASETNVVDRSQVTVDVLNQFVNRIVLSNTDNFTYQDQVYIDNVLEKLGITDVNEFMHQVELLHEENTSISKLTSLYGDNLTILQKLLQTAEEHAAPEERETAEEPPQTANYYLHEEIFDRLQTNAIYNQMMLIKSSSLYGGDYISNEELRLAEQYRTTNLLQLGDVKNELRSGDAVSLNYLENSYETGELLPLPENEEQVIRQLVEASLLNVVSRVMTVKQHEIEKGTTAFYDLSESFAQVAENTVARYQTFHTELNQRVLNNTALAESRNALYREEYTLLDRLLHGPEKAPGEQGKQQRVRVVMPSIDDVIRRVAGEPDETPIIQKTERDHLVEALRQVIYTEKELSRTTTLIDTGTVENIRNFLHNERISIDAKAAVTEFVVSQPQFRQYLQLEQNYTNLPPADIVHPPEQVENTYESVLNQMEEQHAVTVDTQNIVQRLFQPQIQYVQPVTVEPGEQTNEQLLRELQFDTMEHETTKLEHVENNETLLREQLDRINEHNREMAEKLKEIVVKETGETPVTTVDSQKSMGFALKALQDPEKALREMAESQPPVEMAHPELPPIVQAILAQADEPTRNFYQAILTGQPVPGDTNAPIVQATENLGAFNAEMMQAERAAMELIHDRQQEADQLQMAQDTAQEFTQRMAETPQAGVIREPASRPREPLSLVHKQEQQLFSDELLETLNNRREIHNDEVVTEEDRIDHSVKVTNVLDQTHQTVERTSQDVTELINKTLAKQLGTISDKVYNQMEKRLRMERARRGR